MIYHYDDDYTRQTFVHNALILKFIGGKQTIHIMTNIVCLIKSEVACSVLQQNSDLNMKRTKATV